MSFLAINNKVALIASFGPANTGLATVGYTLKNGDGTTFQARTTTGVAETAAPGVYRVELAASVFTAFFDGYVVWDTGGGSPVYAVEDMTVTDRLDATVSSRSTYAGADTPGTTTLLARLTAGRATNLDNLDAAISGIATAVWAAATRTLTAISDSAGVTTLLSRLTAGRATNLDNLDVAVSTVAAAVWGVGTRTLTSFGTLAADVATAVWAAGTRTLTAISDSTGVTTLLSRLTAGRATNLDNLDAAVSSRPSGADYTAGRAAKLDHLVGDTETIRNAE